MRYPSRHATFLALAMGVSGLVGLVASEITLRVIEKVGVRKFDSLGVVFAESFYFHHWREGQPLLPSADRFDPILGWRAGSRASAVPGKVTYNAQGWRSSVDYSLPKTKKRVILIGDSYTFGSNISDDATIASQLQTSLGNKFEVLSLAAEGYAIDQMALVAMTVAPSLEPDYVVMGIIADDLRRSCLSFAWGQALKPYYERRGEELILRGTPLLSPEENLKRHRAWPRRVRDAIEATLVRSRALNVLAGPFLRLQNTRCVGDLNARLLAAVKAKLSPRTVVLFYHLDGKLPEAFIAEAAKRNIGFDSLAEREPAAAKKLGVTPGTSDGYHPNPARARVIAELYAELILGSSRDVAAQPE